MNKVELERSLIIWLTGGILYFYIEILFRGFSHYSMFICGGLCFLLVGKIGNKIIRLKRNKIIKIGEIMIIGSAIITSLEFATGIIVNKLLNMNVWDYSNEKYNVLGQICITYSGIWALLSLVCVYIYKEIYKKIFT